jgi:hypothetical protein
MNSRGGGDPKVLFSTRKHHCAKDSLSSQSLISGVGSAECPSVSVSLARKNTFFCPLDSKKKYNCYSFTIRPYDLDNELLSLYLLIWLYFFTAGNFLEFFAKF